MYKETKILRPNPLKLIGLLIVCILFVTAGVYFFESNSFISWVGVIGFGLGCIVFTVSLFPNSSYLKLTNEGF